MTGKRRIAALAEQLADAIRRSGRCPGRGVIAELVPVTDQADAPNRNPCIVCGGSHHMIIHEVIVGAQWAETASTRER